MGEKKPRFFIGSQKNHRIVKAGKDLQDHPAQPSPKLHPQALPPAAWATFPQKETRLVKQNHSAFH